MIDPLSLDIVDQPKMWKMSNQFNIFHLVLLETRVVLTDLGLWK